MRIPLPSLAIGLWILLAMPLGTLAQTESTVTRSLRRTPLVDAVQWAMPSVVNIHGPKTIEVSEGEGNRRVNGMGTGVVIDERGYILTNYHVIDGVRPIQVTLADERTYTARLVARDTHTDLAIIKIKTGAPLPRIRIGTSSDLMLAESVFAIGNAYGYHGTVSRGVISALSRSVEVTDSQRYFDLIQTDASINPGNSGGPLVNADGQMIGINVAVRVGADGIAFAIPVDRAVEVAASLLATEQTSGTWHGIQGKARSVGGKSTFVVDRVATQSPAEKAGLQAGDHLVRIGKITVERQLDVERAFLGLKPGTEAEMEIVRKERAVPVQLVVAELPDAAIDVSLDKLVWSQLGIRVSPVGSTALGLQRDQYRGGLRITAVRAEGPAAKVGIEVGDILVGLKEWETTALTDLEYILARITPSEASTVRFFVVRESEARDGRISVARR